MNCDYVLERIDDYVDGALTARDQEAVAGHLDFCRACSEAVAQTEVLLSAARALPKDLEPPRDQWPAIAAQIERPARELRWMRPALATAAVVLLAWAGWTGLSGLPAPEARDVAGPPETLRTALAGAEDDCAVVRRALMELYEQERAQLPVEACAEVDAGLAEIRAAAALIGDALRDDPGNAGLAKLLMTARTQEIDVLERVLVAVGTV